MSQSMTHNDYYLSVLVPGSARGIEGATGSEYKRQIVDDFLYFRIFELEDVIEEWTIID